MTRVRLSAALFACALGVALAGCGGGAGDVPSGAVAVVDGIEIPRADLDVLVAQAKKNYEVGDQEFPKVGTPEYRTIQQQYVAFLVQKTEFEQELEAFGLEITEKDVDKARQELLESRFEGDEKKLADALEQQGLTEETFRETLRVSVLSQKIFDAVTKDVKVTDSEALAYYTQNKATTYPDTRKVRHILISEKRKNGQIDFAKSKVEADRVYAQLEGGADFAALARELSDDTGSGVKGGDLGEIKRGQTVAEFEAVAFQLETGEVSKPVKSEFGYHLIEPLADVKSVPFAQIKDVIKAQLVQERKNEEMKQWVEDLQKRYEGKVSYAQGFAPPELPEPTATETE